MGRHLKCPAVPLWLVASESHFTLLALRAAPEAGRGAGGGGGARDRARACAGGALCEGEQRGEAAGECAELAPPFVLQHYDGLACQEAPVLLHVTPAPAAGWATRLAGAADRGAWRGDPVPPLELVVETRWPDVGVAWEGCEPLL